MVTETADLDFTPQRVKGIRVGLGETQDEFAKRLKVVPYTVQRWESGRATPTKGPVLRALLDAELDAEKEAQSD